MASSSKQWKSHHCERTTRGSKEESVAITGASAAAVGRAHNGGEAGSFGRPSNTTIGVFEVKINGNGELLDDFAT